MLRYSPIKIMKDKNSKSAPKAKQRKTMLGDTKTNQVQSIRGKVNPVTVPSNTKPPSKSISRLSIDDHINAHKLETKINAHKLETNIKAMKKQKLINKQMKVNNKQMKVNNKQMKVKELNNKSRTSSLGIKSKKREIEEVSAVEEEMPSIKDSGKVKKSVHTVTSDKSYLPVNYDDFKAEDKIGGLVENSEIGCAAVNLQYRAIVIDGSIENSCIYYVLRGKLTASINGQKKFNLVKGDVMSLDNGQSYEIVCNSRNGSKLLMSYSK